MRLVYCVHEYATTATHYVQKMKTELFQIDAFASRIFEGNPAAVCPLKEWLPDETLQQIAEENNLSETAFFVEEGDHYRLRWFTPKTEVDLCGHATLASAHVLYHHLNYPKEVLVFETNSGTLNVQRQNDDLVMNFPEVQLKKAAPPLELHEALELQPIEVFHADDYLWVLENEEEVKNLRPDLRKIAEFDARGVIVTAPGDEVDFVSRFFAPAVGVDEDPVTGSAHCMLTPYWAKRLGKDTLHARQLSQRGGDITCTMLENRVELRGSAVTYLRGEIWLEKESVQR